MLDERANISAKALPDAAEVFSDPPKLDPLVGNVRVLEEWYSTTFKRRIRELSEMLNSQIAEQLRLQFDSEVQAEVERINSQWEAATESLKKEVENFQKHSATLAPNSAPAPHNDALDEIARIETSLDQIEAELEHSFTADSVPLSRLLQLRTTQSELKSYLRGLKFYAAKPVIEARFEEMPSLRR